MLILAEPYISAELTSYAAQTQEAVLDNAQARSAARQYGQQLNLVDDAAFAALCQGNPRLYTNSENALEWLYRHCHNKALLSSIDLLKDKAACRQRLAPLNPEFFFRRLSLAELTALPFEQVQTPCIIKPAVGFFSLGVYSIENAAQWEKARQAIVADAAHWQEQFPPEVVAGSDFILESYITGDEYAVDVYFDADGKAVICNILRHEFASAADVSDRLYYTSKDIIETCLEEFEHWFERVNALLGLRNFPVHVELRRSATGLITPIEFNPLRFAGWCSTDISLFAWGFQTYACFLEGTRPRWEQALQGKDGQLYTMIVLTRPENCPPDREFDYTALKKDFAEVLCLRPSDYHRYTHYGFMYTRTPVDHRQELDRIVRSDLTEYLR